VALPALRALGGVASGTDAQTQVVIDCGALLALRRLMVGGCYSDAIKKEAAWAASNIMAGTRAQIQAALDAGLAAPLMHLLQHDDADIKTEAGWAVANAAHGGTSEQVRALVRLGCIPPLCGLLDAPDAADAGAVLCGVSSILSAGDEYLREAKDAGALEKLEALAASGHERLRGRARALLEQCARASEGGGRVVFLE
jgi:hypothetical protein